MKKLWKKWKRKAAFAMACFVLFGGIAGSPVLNLPVAGQEAAPASEISPESEYIAETEAESSQEPGSAEKAGTEIIEEPESVQELGTETKEEPGCEREPEETESGSVEEPGTEETETELGSTDETVTEAETESGSTNETVTEPGNGEEPGTEETETESGSTDETVTEPTAESEETITEPVPELSEDPESPKETEAETPQDPVDRTDDADEVGIAVSEVTVLNASGKKLVCTGPSAVDGASQYDASANAYYDVAKVTFKLEISVEKYWDGGGDPDAARKLKAGDYLELAVPAGFSFSGESRGEMKDSSDTLIASYEFASGVDGADGRLKIVFADAVNAGMRNDNIVCGMNVEMAFQADALKGKDKTAELLPARGNELRIVLKLPEEPDTIDGISKTGKLNATTNEITWKIIVGTDTLSKGILLDGVTLTEELPEELELTAAAAKNAKNEDVTVTVSKDADNEPLKLILSGDNAVAPVTVTVTTNIKADALTDAVKDPDKESLELTNKVSMGSSDDSLQFGGNTSAQSSVSVKLSPKVDKQGVQIDSNTIRWTINVNSEKTVRVYRGYVVDALAGGLEYKKGSITCKKGGAQQGVTETDTDPGTGSGTWPSHHLWVEEGAANQTLYFYMAEDTQDAYTITFDTVVSDDFMAGSTGTEETEVHNEATVHAQFPTGNGTIPVEYGIPGINIVFQTAKINKEVSADGTKKRGQLTWSIYPSVRTSSYTTAEITDKINDNQKYLADTLKIYEKTGGSWTESGIGTDETASLIEKNVFSVTYDETEKVLTLKYTKANAASSGHSEKLGDYKIVYETDALTYLRENNKSDTYINTAVLEVTDGGSTYESRGSASAKLQNDWAKKTTKFEYTEDGTPCFHYTITVNNKGIQNLENVTVKDSIKEAITIKDNSEDISGDWAFDDTRTQVLVGGAASSTAQTAYTDENREVEITIPGLSKTAVVELYAIYVGDRNKLTTGVYANKEIQSNNTAEVKSDEVAAVGGVAIPIVSDEKNNKMDNTLVQKKCIDTTNSGGTKLTWQVIINPNSGTMGTLAITDTIPKTQKYIEDSVKLYEADYTGGTLQKKEPGETLSLPTLKFDVSKTERTMELELAADNQTRILEYQTVLVDSGTKKVTNEIQVSENRTDYGTGVGEKDLSGGNWGSLTSAGTLILQKQDASIGSDMPLAGAEFTIYADEAGTKPVDVGETGEDGTVTFYGLDVLGTGLTQTYWYKETKTPEGYREDTQIHEVTVEKGVKRTYTVENIRKTETNQSSKVTLTKKFYYKDAAGAEKEAAGLQAAFALKFYPYGEGNNKGAKTVSLTGADGSYTYVSSTSTAPGGAVVTEIKNDAGTGQIVIEGLPWGYYGITETKTAAGFALDTEHYFEIQNNDNMDVIYKFGSNTDKNNAVLTNTATQFQAAKYETGTTNLISGIHLQICEKRADGQRGSVVTDALNENIPYEWDTVDAPKTIYNLPAGTYFLHEDAQQSMNQNYAVAKADTEFTVLPDGTIKGAADKIVKVYNKPISLSVTKVDQFGAPVAGAEIRMEGISGFSYDQKKQTTATEGGNILTFDGLVRNGEYTLTESAPPDAEHLAIDPVTVKVSADGNSFVFVQTGADDVQTPLMPDADGTLHLVDTKLFVPITLQKADVLEAGTFLADAEFKLYGQKFETMDGTWQEFCKVKTGADGSFKMSGMDDSVKNPFDTTKKLSVGLKPGRYYIEETKAPAGYKALPAGTKMPFEITSEGIIQLAEDAKYITVSGTVFTVSNMPLTLRIQPLEFDNGYDEGLGDKDLNGTGAVYQVSGIFLSDDGIPAAEKIEMTLAGTQDGAFDQGNALKGKLIPGEVYTIAETTAPEGFVAPEPVYVKIDEYGKAVLCSADGSGAGDGGSYAKTENLDSFVDGVANGYNGLVKIYHGKTKAQLVKYSSWNSAEKKEETDKAAYQTLSGVTFTLTGKLSGGRTSAEYVTDTEGRVLFAGDLVEGEAYTLTETTPAGYKESDAVTFTFETETGITLSADAPENVAADRRDGIPSIEITNETAQNTSLQFLVYDCTDGTGLAGAEFNLICTPADGGSKTETVLVTKEAGQVYPYVTAGETHEKITAVGEAFVSGLQPGEYTLIQTKAPYGYSLSEESIVITFKVDAYARNKTIVINETNVENGAFGLTATDSGPKVVGKGICNKRIDGSVVIEKQDYDDGTPLDGVGFAIYRYREADNIFDILHNLVTGKAYAVAEKEWTESETDAGSLKITGLEWGKYYIVETSPLKGYAIDKTKYDFVIGKDQPTQVLEWKPGAFINAKIQLILPPTNADTDKADVAGHKMRIAGRFQNADVPYIEWEETDQPYIISGMLIPGEVYTLEEVTALPGYNGAVEFQFKFNGYGQIEAISSDGAVDIVVEEDGTVKLIRKVVPLKIRIRKTDADGNLLAGAVLSLYVQDGTGARTLVAETTTDTSAWELTGDRYNMLQAGASCILTEKSAPEGYELAEDVAFTVVDDAAWQEYTMIDRRKQEEPTEPGEDPGNKPGEGTEIDPGSKPGEGTETEPGEDPGSKPGEGTETDPGNTPGDGTETDPGKDPGNTPGEGTETDPGKKPGAGTGKKPDKDAGSETGKASESEPEVGTENNTKVKQENIAALAGRIGGETVDSADAAGAGDRALGTAVLLPQTGREERTGFYVVGGMLVAAGAALLYGTRKRSGKRSENRKVFTENPD